MKKSPKDKALIEFKKKWLEDALDAFSENHLDLTCDVVDRYGTQTASPFLRQAAWKSGPLPLFMPLEGSTSVYDKSFDPYISMDDLVNYFKDL